MKPSWYIREQLRNWLRQCSLFAFVFAPCSGLYAQTSDPIPNWAADSARRYPADHYQNSIVGQRVDLSQVMTDQPSSAATVPTESVVQAGYGIQDDASNMSPMMRESSPYAIAACDPNGDFAPTPLPNCGANFDPCAAAGAYDNKHLVPTQRPWIEWGFPFYGPGITPPANTRFSWVNPLRQKFYLYGDFRAGIGTGENNAGEINNLAGRLNLEADWQLTATGRLHGGFQPLTQGVEFTRVDYRNGSPEFVQEFNPNFATGFFEGDLGVMLGALTDSPAPVDIPIAVGLLPLFLQNGVWMDDAVVGAAISMPARHSRLLRWSNFDAMAFAAIDEINSPAFGNDKNAARLLGTAWFIDAYGGYIEAGWVHINDHDDLGRSYQNASLAFTRRYFGTISNSVRGIVNYGQDSGINQTADGFMLLVENSLISTLPLQLVPYANAFVGWDRPQSVARAAQAGGILRNVGINFETDGLNGYPTLDASGNNTLGGAVGVNWLGLGLDRQVVVEAAYVHGFSDDASRIIPGDEFALGSRYQMPLTNATLIRMDAMYGWRESADNLWGMRLEWRWKF